MCRERRESSSCASLVRVTQIEEIHSGAVRCDSVPLCSPGVSRHGQQGSFHLDLVAETSVPQTFQRLTISRGLLSSVLFLKADDILKLYIHADSVL